MCLDTAPAPQDAGRVPAAPASLRPSAIEGMFSAIAPRYDFLNSLLSAGRDRAWRREAVRAVALPPRGMLLDVCTGTADMLLEAMRQYPDARILGVDFSSPMLTVAARKLEGAGLRGRVVLQAALAEALPFADETFDAATIAFGLRNLADRLRGLREMHRVLKVGGRAVILEFSTPPGRIVRCLYLWYLHWLLPRLGRLVSGHPSAYSYLPASVAAFPPPDALTCWMREVGFSDVAYRLLTGGIVAIHVGRK